ncbi:MAG: FAD-binding oxidoreductase [Flavobacteriales bacterium]|nr:FAD-binding oxidoreductase [Flavobacteriales bacterium]
MDALFPTPHPHHFSYWELERYFADIDLLVVGSGIVGLTTAIYCKQREPGLRVTVVERGVLPSGASTKNAGFACFGSLGELLADSRQQPMDAVFQRAEDRLQGLVMLRSLLGDEAIGYDACGGYELFTNEQEELFEASMALLKVANERFGTFTGFRETYLPDHEASGRFGLKGANHMILNRGEGAIDTGRMMQSLISKARETGIEVMTGIGISSLEDLGQSVDVMLDSGHSLRVKRVHVATNGFARQLLPELDVSPARAQVLITSPIEGLKLKGTFHLEEGFYYFRNVGNRVLLGGGRNLDIVGETTAEAGLSRQIQVKLDDLLATMILPDTHHVVAHRWSGVMGVGGTKDPIICHLSARISCAVRMGGMGVALGTLVGKRSAEMILG